ncbi:hypothetical protein F441_09207 [Phytophthora nicotianae CJ01A1]|uniref:RxLR effector protein n=7 Tax=Phytophthora nicotianae TaxID=4792 RepID=V9F5N4_PHYNI|nr:hypothetical protein F443_09246 [Phytophthora nicotianae P1569]ETK86295.1 hypothetical protein L915_09067 [Phytophthora nicotianae]ETO75039.1 hypothetical protein F444_09331 [Phytophthora nicotianae P1976]ETP16171.1 hypothetical protein F441_09207 [Phytophthora nicotianae CJ01A1]ETP44222.1 hypothetical protein F442_09171 [Phytophthora nicotianae P10297]
MDLMLRFLLLSVFALLSVAVKATEFHHTKISRTDTSGYGGRLLRTARMSDDEARGVLIPGLKNWRVTSWIKNGKSDDYVMDKLKLTGLIGRALTEDPNFKYFQKFKVDGWLKKGASTTTAWDDLGLNSIALGEVTKVDTFRIYQQYITELNKKAENIPWDRWSNLFGGGSETELAIKVSILAKLGRTDSIDLQLMVESRGMIAFLKAVKKHGKILDERVEMDVVKAIVNLQ